MNFQTAFILTFLFGFIAVILCAPTNFDNENDFNDLTWTEYKFLYGKSYTVPSLERVHEEIFLKRSQQIKEHNAAFARGETSFTLGYSKFTDMTDAELARRKGFRPHAKRAEILTKIAANFTLDGIDFKKLPKSVDWRKGNGTVRLVTKVKDQGQCGSCWAFSTTGALEAANAKATGKLLSLSEQNLVDCDRMDHGCDGGDEIMATYFVLQQGGVETEAAYPYKYKGDNQRCKFNATKPMGATMVRQVVTMPYGDEKVIKAAVALHGPISVAIEVTNVFQSYSRGVLNDTTCGNQFESLDHAVLVVGYGTDPKFGDFWIVKNSWGADWGEKGYIRMSRNKKNQCGIATETFFVQ